MKLKSAITIQHFSEETPDQDSSAPETLEQEEELISMSSDVFHTRTLTVSWKLDKLIK